ncbi:putative signal peptide protein [Puccinia sorghi]|uniref:Putative signal peptide protein n=1 Tax=Puccinia sorghi TaxID=27349 RepID=A0A0L6U941_9BASI|nr:putative signal peptide protein [Puccinia sorghi]
MVMNALLFWDLYKQAQAVSAIVGILAQVRANSVMIAYSSSSILRRSCCEATSIALFKSVNIGQYFLKNIKIAFSVAYQWYYEEIWGGRELDLGVQNCPIFIPSWVLLLTSQTFHHSLLSFFNQLLSLHFLAVTFPCLSKCFHITFLDKPTITSRIFLKKQPDVLPGKLCDSCLMTYVLSSNDHNSYQLWSPFYELQLILFCDFMIVLRIWIKDLLVSLYQFLNLSVLDLKIYNTEMTLPNDKGFFTAWLPTTLVTVQFMILLQFESWQNRCNLGFGESVANVEGQTNSLCKSLLSSSSSSEDATATLPQTCKHLPKAGILSPKCTAVHIGENADSQPSEKHSARHHNMLEIIKLTSLLGDSSKHCDCIIAKGFFYILQPSYQRVVFTKIRLNLCTNNNQHQITGISSVCDQVTTKHLHASACKTSLVFVILSLLILMIAFLLESTVQFLKLLLTRVTLSSSVYLKDNDVSWVETQGVWDCKFTSELYLFCLQLSWCWPRPKCGNIVFYYFMMERKKKTMVLNGNMSVSLNWDSPRGLGLEPSFSNLQNAENTLINMICRLPKKKKTSHKINKLLILLHDKKKHNHPDSRKKKNDCIAKLFKTCTKSLFLCFPYIVCFTIKTSKRMTTNKSQESQKYCLPFLVRRGEEKENALKMKTSQLHNDLHSMTKLADNSHLHLSTVSFCLWLLSSAYITPPRWFERQPHRTTICCLMSSAEIVHTSLPPSKKKTLKKTLKKKKTLSFGSLRIYLQQKKKPTQKRRMTMMRIEKTREKKRHFHRKKQTD